jgi:enterochelin esterase-like enzyme
MVVDIYLPARVRRSRQYPLLIVHDGGDYLRYSSLRTVLDNLIHRLEIPSMLVALTTVDHLAVRRPSRTRASSPRSCRRSRRAPLRRGAQRGCSARAWRRLRRRGGYPGR